MTLYEIAQSAKNQLDPGVQWAAQRFVDACWGKKFFFRADLPAIRTAQQQNALYQRGRTKPGRVVTHLDGFTKRSEHQDGMAWDLYPENCTYEDLTQIAVQFGIVHPWPKSQAKKNKGFVDEPHYSFVLVKKEPPPFREVIDPQAERRRAQRQAKNEKDPAKRKRILDRLNRAS